MASHPKGTAHHWLCCGRFPPPRDGQSIATQELVELLAPDFTFTCLNSAARPPEGRIIPPGQLRMKRVGEMLRYLLTLRSFTARYPLPILYAILSGNWLGHLRDCAAFAWAIPQERPIVVWTHNSLSGLHDSAIWHRTLGWLARRARFFVFAAPRLAKPLCKLLPEDRVTFIPNPIARAMLCSSEEIHQKLRATDLSAGLRLLFVGHMIPEKGGWRVLEAAAQLQRDEIPFHLTYVGEWPDADAPRYFFTQVDRLGLRSRVTHRGGIHEPGVIRQLLLRNHVLVFPTTYAMEAQPLVVLEALNAGCAVVSTPHAAIPDVVQSGVNGFLTPPHPDEIARAVARYWHEPGLWHKHASTARQHFETYFSPAVIRYRWAELLRHVEQELSHAGPREQPTPSSSC
ncbi:MAG: glycosyltransferase [Candidatus Kapabacteria bacterium]|nr:glycosyltransferase [Candidatus Kapabacteria bacterium]MCS7169798.1 glycosyltransferase [Candidatus Kapabacteria bacterium]MDW7997647.1 glycosyltransferase [Bacteroidota bacterium]MDW8224806.1 glycosyltransferase [Bacteroidota bacterium]